MKKIGVPKNQQDPTHLPTSNAQQELNELEERYHRLITRMSALVFELTPEGLTLAVNEPVTQLTGYTPKALYGKNWWEIFMPGEYHEQARHLVSLLQEADVSNYELTLVTQKGEPIVVEMNSANYYDQEGNLKRIVGFGIDVSERKRAEETLKESEERFRLLVSGVKEYAILTLDPYGIVTSWNASAENIHGYPAEKIIGQHFSLFYTPEDREQGLPQKVLQEAIQKRHYEHEGWRVRQDGSRFWASAAITPLYDEGERLRGFAKVVRDMSRRKKSEEALRASEALFRATFEGAPLGIELVDLEGRLLKYNPAICEMLGYNQEEMELATSGEIHHPVNVVANTGWFDELRAGKRDFYRLEKPFQSKSGRTVWGRLSVSLVRDDQGQPQFAIGMLEDNTEQRQIEAELIELQRRLMEGRESERVHLAQELHDGPIQELYGATYLLEAFSNELPSHTNRQTLDEMKERIQGVVNTLRAICGEMRPPALAPFGLEKAIRSHIQTFREDHPELEIRLDLTPDEQALPEQVRLALFRIYQATMSNILRHANASKVAVRFALDAEEAYLEIEDDGIGFVASTRWIDLARRGHLGLVGAAERAEAIGGKLQVDTAPGEGTRISVTVPLNE